jgi:hypothetical protein
VWAPATRGPKSNIDDLTIFDIAINPATLARLNTSTIMVGLNIARSFAEPLRNFHDSNPHANDFKLRHGFRATSFYGAYMTDIIKNVVKVKSIDLLSHLRARPSLIDSNVAAFRQELHDLRCPGATILAFGRATYELLAEILRPGEYGNLIPLTHYSCYISKEKYRERVLAQIDSHSSGPRRDDGAA